MTGGAIIGGMKAIVRAVLIGALTAGCSAGPTSTLAPSVEASSPTPVPAPADSCGTTTEGVHPDEITIQSIPSSPYGPGILVSALITSKSCSELVLTPSSFALLSPTGVLKCGDPRLTELEARTYGGPPFPLALEPGSGSPIVVAFDGLFVETSGILFYADLGRHCP